MDLQFQSPSIFPFVVMGLFLKTHKKRTEEEIMAAFGAELDSSSDNNDPQPPQPTDASGSSSLVMSSMGGGPGGRLCFCATFAWFLRPVVSFGKLHFIHVLTNATDDHKYSPLPSVDFDSAVHVKMSL